MSITRVGSTKKFAEGWDGIFAGNGRKPRGKKATGKKASSKKKAAKKSAKQTAPAPSGHLAKKKHKPRKPDGKNDGPGDATAKKSAAKRTSKTPKRRAQPALQQMELF